MPPESCESSPDLPFKTDEYVFPRKIAILNFPAIPVMKGLKFEKEAIHAL